MRTSFAGRVEFAPPSLHRSTMETWYFSSSAITVFHRRCEPCCHLHAGQDVRLAFDGNGWGDIDVGGECANIGAAMPVALIAWKPNCVSSELAKSSSKMRMTTSILGFRLRAFSAMRRFRLSSCVHRMIVRAVEYRRRPAPIRACRHLRSPAHPASRTLCSRSVCGLISITTTSCSSSFSFFTTLKAEMPKANQDDMIAEYVDATAISHSLPRARRLNNKHCQNRSAPAPECRSQSPA